MCENLSSCVVHTLKSFDYSSDCLGGMGFVGEKVNFYYFASMNHDSQIKNSLAEEIK